MNDRTEVLKRLKSIKELYNSLDIEALNRMNGKFSQDSTDIFLIFEKIEENCDYLSLHLEPTLLKLKGLKELQRLKGLEENANISDDEICKKRIVEVFKLKAQIDMMRSKRLNGAADSDKINRMTVDSE